MENCCDIFDVFDEKSNLIKEYQYWKLLISNRPKTLGNCVAITKNHHENFSDLNKEEMAEFNDVVKDVEKALKKAFNYDKINYLMLMMKDKHTHFHIIPRYKDERDFAGIKWVDGLEPNVMNLKKVEFLQEQLNEVKSKIISNLAI